jgi:hypothetical protein
MMYSPAWYVNSPIESAILERSSSERYAISGTLLRNDSIRRFFSAVELTTTWQIRGKGEMAGPADALSTTGKHEAKQSSAELVDSQACAAASLGPVRPLRFTSAHAWGGVCV